MKRLSLLTAVAVAVSLVSLSLPAAAQTTKSKADPAKGKEIVGTVCVACHSMDGNSEISANPKLAGQHAEYLLKQMREFKSVDGATPIRVNAIMNGMIAAYDDAQMRDIAAYLSAQRLKPETATNRETVELGQRLYRAGDASKGLPACIGCHGPTGTGMPAQFPRIGGQFADYIAAQLHNFRTGAEATEPSDEARTNDPEKMMRMVAAKMSDKEIAAVADYIAGLR
ncbi:MAG: cytochrome c4 [Sterolibacterium sp.]|nr:cytochrome c4 [Sterolibacterium sp.]